MLRIDTNEPPEILKLLMQCEPNTSLEPLNDEGLADYFWFGAEYDSNLERKTWNDVASDADAIEVQLYKQHILHPECRHRLLIEGLMAPEPNGVSVYSETISTGHSKWRDYPGKPGMYSRLISQVLGWGEFIEILPPSPNVSSSALMIAALYHRDQKPDAERTTFRRYFKQITWRPNLQVSRLLGMALNDTNIGPDRAEDLIDEFGTVWNTIHAAPEDWSKLRGFSAATARNFLRKIGRPNM